MGMIIFFQPGMKLTPALTSTMAQGRTAIGGPNITGGLFGHFRMDREDHDNRHSQPHPCQTVVWPHKFQFKKIF
jgi:hypothetical protein